jgi:hypothetical protein
MSTYFKNFPVVSYSFGDDENRVFFEDISAYVDMIDTATSNVSAYSYYTINDFDRPDTLSYKLYGTTDYYWTFFMMNENLREQNWPLHGQQLFEFAKRVYPDYAVQIDGTYRVDGVITTFDAVDHPFRVYASDGVTKIEYNLGSNTSSGVAYLVRSNNNIAQFVFDLSSSGLSVADQQLLVENLVQISWTESGVAQVFNSSTSGTIFTTKTTEYNAVHHYENSDGDWVDIDPQDLTSIGSNIPVTNYGNLVVVNDALKQIKIIRPDKIIGIVGEFHRLMKG